MVIQENTICYASELGHNNFWYPSSTKLLIKNKCDAEQMSWISGGRKVPIKVLKSNLIPLNITENTTFNISPPTKNDYTVVWLAENV